MPPGVVTVTAAEALPAGATAAIRVGESTRNDLAARAPNRTALTSTKLVPATVTFVPPLAGPVDGLSRATVGAARYLKLAAAISRLVPRLVVTVTATVPVPLGATATIVPEDRTVNEAAFFAPKCTALARARPEPWIVTLAPPRSGPASGVIPVTVVTGTGPAAAQSWSTRPAPVPVPAPAIGVPSPVARS